MNRPTKIRQKSQRFVKLKEVQANAQSQRFCTTFNFTPTHPSPPTTQVPANEIYLNKLLLPNGLKPRWRRIGSTSTFSITKSIDMYEIFDNQGETVCTLYINPYHLKISNKIPKGFKSSK
jgi:hypothetical protein